MINNLRKTNIRSKARRTRELCGVQSCLAPDIVILLNKAAEVEKDLKIKPMLSAEMNEDEAWLDSTSNTIYVREAVMVGAQSGNPRDRFTLAHELGHFALRHDGAPRRNPNRQIYTSAKDRTKEEEANLFASYLLAPTELVVACENVQEVQDKFQLSSQAAELAFERAKEDARRDKGEPRILPDFVVEFIKPTGRN